MSRDARASRAVTVVTAVGRREPLPWQEAQIRSVTDFAARHPGRMVRWIRSLDGEDASVADVASGGNLEVLTLPATSSNRIGIAATRNRFLSMLPDGWVVTLDSDDVLFPDALGRQIVATEHAGVLWSAALCDDISPDGEKTIAGPDVLTPGTLAAGTFLEYTVRKRVSPWCCSATLIDAEHLRMSGGWAEFSEEVRLDDTALIARVTSNSDGVWVPVVVQGYRKHRNQTTAGRDELMDAHRIALVKKYVADGADRRVSGHK